MKNLVLLTGNIGDKAQVRVLENSIKVANVSLATNEYYKDKRGEKIQRTEWHTLEIWGKLAEVAEKYFEKGIEISVRGSLTTSRWQDESGTWREKTKVRVAEFEFGKKKGGARVEDNTGQVEDKDYHPTAGGEDDDLPF